MDIVCAVSTGTQNKTNAKNNDYCNFTESLYSEINDIQQGKTIEICQNLTHKKAAIENEYIASVKLDSQTENHKILTCKRICNIATRVILTVGVGMLVLVLAWLCYGVYHFDYLIGDYIGYNNTPKHVETEINTNLNSVNFGPGHKEYETSVKSMEKAVSQGNCHKSNPGSLKVDFHNLFKKECKITRTKLKLSVKITDRFTLSSINNSIWVVSGFNLSIYSQDLELKQQCRMGVYMRDIKKAYNGDLIVISSIHLYKMERICGNLEAIDKRSYYENDYYDALVLHACSFYVLFYNQKKKRDRHDYIDKKERYYKIRKFSYATNNNTWNCVEEIKFTLRSLDPRNLKISSMLIYKDHFYLATTRKDVSSVVKYSMTGNLVEKIITKLKNKYGLQIYAVDTGGKFLTTEYYIENSYRKDRLLLLTDSLLTQLKILNLKLDMKIEDFAIDDENNLWILGHRGDSNNLLNNMWKLVHTDERDNFYTLLRCNFL